MHAASAWRRRARTAAGLLHRLRALSWRSRLLLAEAGLLLAAASLAIALLPFRAVARIAAWPRREARVLPPNLHASTVLRVRWAVRACARQVPWRAVCFQQGLAAHWMLRRRGIASKLHYGVAPAPDAHSGLEAHVWVRSGTRDVVGSSLAQGFALLTTIPEDRMTSHKIYRPIIEDK